MQKIEASLSARSNEEKNRLEEENKRLTEVLMSDRSKSSFIMIEQMQNKLDEAEKHVTEKGKMVLSLTSESEKAKVAFSNLSATI
jgi:Mg2+ and Co2+ transporter CorA